jgi:hypothetical protein
VPDGSPLTHPGPRRPRRRRAPPGCAAIVRHAVAGVHCAPAANHPRPSPSAGKSLLLPQTLRRVHPRAWSRLPCGITSAQGPWLQFWLQFTTVRVTPGRYAPQVTDVPGPARTVDIRAFNPWVQGSSPWRPTRSDLAFRRSGTACWASGMGGGWPGYGRCLDVRCLDTGCCLASVTR